MVRNSGHDLKKTARQDIFYPYENGLVVDEVSFSRLSIQRRNVRRYGNSFGGVQGNNLDFLANEHICLKTSIL